MTKSCRLFLIIILFSAFVNVTGQQNSIWSYKNNDQPAVLSYNLLDSIFETARGFLKTKYVYGGCSEKGFDCSGFIYYIFNKYNILLSRSSGRLSSIGQNVDFEDIREGDLLFFKSRNMSSDKVGHVSLVICKTENSFQMIHATNRGVVIDNYSDISYYQNRFLFAKRFISIDESCHM